MPTSWVDNFYYIDPFSPPPPGTTLTATNLTVRDRTSNGQIGSGQGDRVDGSRIIGAYPGDTLTVEYPSGATQTITGVTFYLQNGQQVFSPIDGTTLQDAVYVSAGWVPTNTSVTPTQMQLTCFTPRSHILTPDGEVLIDRLRVGDMVETLDNGPQEIRWIGRRVVEGQGEFAPIRFKKGAIGNRRGIRVSPQHRMLITGWRAQLLFGMDELLVSAKNLVNDASVRVAPCDEVEYIHLMFDRHEVIFTEGIATESFHPGERVLTSDRKLMAELMTLFPDVLTQKGPHWSTARGVVKAYEATAYSITWPGRWGRLERHNDIAALVSGVDVGVCRLNVVKGENLVDDRRQ